MVRVSQHEKIMNIRVEHDKPKTVYLSGEIDLSNADEAREVLEGAAIESPGGLIANLSELVYIDSLGIQAILAAYRRVRDSGGILVLVITTKPIRRIFDLHGLAHLPGLTVTDDPESAERIISERDG